jgi:ABC-type iron transport system FetAB ATPase subunit
MQVLATALRQEKKIRMIYITKEKSQSIHNADKILHIIDVKDSTRKLIFGKHVEKNSI